MSTRETEELATWLNSAITHLSRRIRRIDDRQDIGRARLSALSVLVFGGPRTAGELARDEMVSAATMHHVVNGLLDLKLARKRADREDGRRAIIEATRAGHTFMEEARKARLDFYTGHLDGLTEKQRAAIREFVGAVNGWLEKGD